METEKVEVIDGYVLAVDPMDAFQCDSCQ